MSAIPNEDKKEQAIVKVQKPPVLMDARGVKLQSMDDLARFATMYFESDLAPSCYKSAQAVAVAMQTGMEAGLSPAAGVRALIIVSDKAKEPTWKGQAALGLIRNSKVCEFFTIGDASGEGDNRSVTIRCKRFDMAVPMEVAFSIGEARRAGLLGKDNWKNYPDDMLTWRAVGRTAKRYFSDVLMGLDIAEDARDFPPVEVRPTTPPQEPDPLLTAAIDVTPIETPHVEPQKAPEPIPPKPADPTPEDQLLASLVEKLEVKIVSAETSKALDRVWNDAQESIVGKCSAPERLRLGKLYKQNRSAFEE